MSHLPSIKRKKGRKDERKKEERKGSPVQHTQPLFISKISSLVSSTRASSIPISPYLKQERGEEEIAGHNRFKFRREKGATLAAAGATKRRRGGGECRREVESPEVSGVRWVGSVSSWYAWKILIAEE